MARKRLSCKLFIFRKKCAYNFFKKNFKLRLTSGFYKKKAPDNHETHLESRLKTTHETRASYLPEEDDGVVVGLVAVVDSDLLQLRHVHRRGTAHQDLHLSV